jgi:hypothetical protein
MDSKIPLKSRDVFIVGGITHVPSHEFPRHLEFFGEMSMLLQYRFGLNPSFALRDNEIWLMELPREQAKYECYRIDQDSVDHAGLIIAELSVPSTGTGQELERAHMNGVPVIAMAKKEIRRENTQSVEYFAEKSDGEVIKNVVKRGAAGVSLMVEGNPAILQPLIAYSNNDAEGRTEALRMLDRMLRERFGLTPLTARLDAAIEIDTKLLKEIDAGGATHALDGRNPAEERKRLAEQVGKNVVRRGMIESLLTFDPKRHDPAEYERMFPHLKRLPLADIERGATEPTFREVRPEMARRNRQG